MVFPLLSLASNSLFAGVSFKPVEPVVDGHKAVSQPFPTGGRFEITDRFDLLTPGTKAVK